jgi:hypothetical protein
MTKILISRHFVHEIFFEQRRRVVCHFIKKKKIQRGAGQDLLAPAKDSVPHTR